MHRCLQIYDLLHCISTHLYPTHRDLPRLISSRTEGAASLAAFARACRTFLEPALDVLWYTQHDLAPLLALCGTPAWEVQAGLDHEECMRLGRRAEDARQWVRSSIYRAIMYTVH